MARVVHFEITADDVERARKFYEIFGWEITTSGMPGVDYWLAHTGEEGMGINGAIMPRAYNPQPVINWVGVGDLDDMIHRSRRRAERSSARDRPCPELATPSTPRTPRATPSA